MSKTILIVDDSASIRQVVGIALRGAGYQVIEACDADDWYLYRSNDRISQKSASKKHGWAHV